MQHLTGGKIMDCIKAIARVGKVETAGRCLTDLERMWEYWRGNLDQHFPFGNPATGLEKNLPRQRRPVNYPAITDPDAFGQMLRLLDDYRGDVSTIDALRISPYLPLRPSEKRLMKWSNLDLESGIYTVPAVIVKQSNEEKETGPAWEVPLPRQVVAMLREIKSRGLRGQYVFPSLMTKKRIHPVSENTLNKALEKLLGPRVQVVHGFRASFKTMCKGKLKLPNEHLEASMGHSGRDANGKAYDRYDFFEERRFVIQRWADLVDTLRGYPPDEYTMTVSEDEAASETNIVPLFPQVLDVGVANMQAS